jgi:bacteriocin-like protein
MNDQNGTKQEHAHELTDDELAQVAGGGDGGPGNPSDKNGIR